MPVTFSPAKILERLTIFNYRHSYNAKDSVIKVYLPMLCYLKIDFKNNKVKMTGRSWVAEDRLEYRVLSVFFALCLFIAFSTMPLLKAIEIFSAFIVIFIYYAICFIKIEAIKAIIHNWIEKDSLA